MDRSPHPRSYLAPRWIGGGLVAAVIFAGGVREAIQTDGQGGEPAVAAATDTVPDTLAPTLTTAPETTVITVPTTTEAPPPVTTTLPDRLNVDTTTTTSTTTTTTTSSSAPPQPPTTVAPETTTLPPETTPPTTEVQPLFQLPEFGQVPAERQESFATETVRIDFGTGGAASGKIIRVNGQVAGAASALHTIEQTFAEDEDGRTVLEHGGYITLQTGDDAENLEEVGRVSGVLIPEGLSDTMLFVVGDADPQAVKQAYEAQLSEQALQQGDRVWVSGWPGEQGGSVDRRQAQPLIYIGRQPDGTVYGQRTGPLDVFVAGTTADSATVTEGYSGAQVEDDAGLTVGTISLGTRVTRQEGIYDDIEQYGDKFHVDLSREDIAAVVLVQPAVPTEMFYYEVRNTNLGEVYAAEIASITAEAHEALLDSRRPKMHFNATVHLNEYFVGSTTASMIDDALIHTDEAGNTLIYGRDPAAPNAGLGLLLFFPANQEGRLKLNAAEGLTQATLFGQTNGDVQPVASMADYPDYLDAYGYVSEDGVNHVIGHGTSAIPPEATATYEVVILNGQITLEQVATGTPPVPPAPPEA